MVGTMKSFSSSATAVRLSPCTYGLSRLTFRGPRRPTDGRFVAFLGGSDTFARYISKPYIDQLEATTGAVCVNLGCQASRPDVYLKDTAVQSVCHDASVVVIQVLGAANLSNAYYKVHPRRNDRFIAPTKRLTTLYPDIDFSEIAFTGHLISRLRTVDAARFALVRNRLQATWVTRMRALIDSASGKAILLWFTSHEPANDSIGTRVTDEPMFVTLEMLNELRDQVADIIEVVVPRGETEGMSFAPLDTLAALDSLGIAAHEAAAVALHDPIATALS